MNAPSPDVDAWFTRPRHWQREVVKLRSILRSCDLDEQLKWGKPTYACEGGNVVLIMPMKETCALLFMKGALLQDPKKLLVQPGENSQSARQMRFSSLAQIEELEDEVKDYVERAIAVERAGLRVSFKKSSDLVYPVEFQERLDADQALREAFFQLTPGRQRQYHMFFTGAKLASTRRARVEKSIPSILDGLGLNDR